MSEDDTFLKLRRTPIQELVPIWRSRSVEFYSTPRILLQWLEQHGWNNPDFVDAINENQMSKQ